MNIFSNRLEILIKENKTKKKDLAAVIGLTPGAITNMIKGWSNPSLNTIRAIARYYRVNEEWLEHGTGERMEPVPTVAEQIGEGYSEAVKLMADYAEMKLKGRTSEERLKEVEEIMDIIRSRYK